MTAQVALMNHYGLALASDTIITLGESKTLGNTSKIYELGSEHKVVVLHNGSVNINGVSSQLHLAEWSQHLTKPLAKLEDYVNSFIEWFNSPRAIYGKDSADDLVVESVRDYYSWIASAVSSEIESIASASELNDESQTEIDKKVTEVIKLKIEQSKSWEPYDDFSESAGTELIASTPNLDLKELIAEEFAGIRVTPGNLKKLISAATLGVNRKSWLPTDSELVFAGFGSAEPFSGIVKLGIRGAYGGRLRCKITGRDAVNAYHPVASLYPFAQDDAIHGFVRGWTNKMRDSTADNIYSAVWSAIDESGVTKDMDVIYQISNQARNSAMEALTNQSLETFAYPLMNTVSAMSLMGLAELSESLIGIQAAATYSKKGAATVGGFVEVVTIDRQYGIRWRKRLSGLN